MPSQPPPRDSKECLGDFGTFHSDQHPTISELVGKSKRKIKSNGNSSSIKISQLSTLRLGTRSRRRPLWNTLGFDWIGDLLVEEQILLSQLHWSTRLLGNRSLQITGNTPAQQGLHSEGSLGRERSVPHFGLVLVAHCTFLSFTCKLGGRVYRGRRNPGQLLSN